VNGATELELAAETVAELFTSLVAAHPRLEGRVLDEDGALRRHLNIYVADEDIRWKQGLDTALSQGDRVTIVTALAGG